MKTSFLISLACLSLGLASCGESGSGAPTASANKAAAGVSKAEKDEHGNAVLSRERLQPFDRYVVMNFSSDFRVPAEQADQTAYQYRDMFWSGAPVDYDLLAMDYLPEYREETDAFKRADIVKANKQQLDIAYKEASAKKYQAFYIEKSRHDGQMARIGPYTAATKGFRIDFDIPDEYSFGWNKPDRMRNGPREGWYVQLVGAQSLFQRSMSERNELVYVPKSEDEARAIEARLAVLRKDKNRTYMDLVSLPIYYLSHIVASNPEPNGTGHTAIAVVDGIILADPETKQPLLTFDLNTVNKKVYSSDFWIAKTVLPQTE